MSREGAEQIALALDWGLIVKFSGVNLLAFSTQPHASVLPMGTLQDQERVSSSPLFFTPLLSSLPFSLPIPGSLDVLTEHSVLWQMSPTPVFMGIFYI